MNSARLILPHRHAFSSYNLFTQKLKEELADFSGWVKPVMPGQGDETASAAIRRWSVNI